MLRFASDPPREEGVGRGGSRLLSLFVCTGAANFPSGGKQTFHLGIVYFPREEWLLSVGGLLRKGLHSSWLCFIFADEINEPSLTKAKKR